MTNNNLDSPQPNQAGKFKTWQRSLLVFLVIILIVGSFQAGMCFTAKSETLKQAIAKETFYLGKVKGLYGLDKPVAVSTDINFSLFWQVWDILKENYVDKNKLNDKTMFYGALRGLVNSVGDPYTVFMDPKIAEEFSNDLAGTFEGIGAELGLKNDVITIIAPLPGMPAEKAGIKSGDKIIAINSEATSNISLDEAIRKIRGPKGTTVTLSIFREGFKKVEDFVVMRDTIIVKSVNGNLRPDNIYLIKISNFNDDTEKLFNNEVNEVISKNPRGIILDLRNDPGGYLETAIEVASEWIEDGVIVIEKFGDDKKNEHLARGRARLKEYPTVVLVNQGSASASEIVAGALQDYKKATIVGKKTFGKGSVQTLQELDDGSSVKVTVAKWLTPNGRSINDEGIEPDVDTDLTEADFNAGKDPQMDKAVEILISGKINAEKIKAEEANASSTGEDIKKGEENK